jgi:hypothetical protein
VRHRKGHDDTCPDGGNTPCALATGSSKLGVPGRVPEGRRSHVSTFEDAGQMLQAPRACLGNVSTVVQQGEGGCLLCEPFVG